MALIHLLVEGDLDEAAGRRILTAAGHTAGTCYGKKGFGYIKNKVKGFNQSARDISYLTLVDFMDTQLTCPADVVNTWLPHRRPKMFFRVVVRELESWLLADSASLSSFLKVNSRTIPSRPESAADPKRVVINLARNSTNRRIRTALVPEQGSTAAIGKLYVTEMTVFINMHWNLDVARVNAPSLDKCLRRLEAIPE